MNSVKLNALLNNIVTLLVLSITLMLLASRADAVPLFARQMGNVPCSTCHTVFPELNSFGRTFKLRGYTFSSGEAQIPLAGMLLLSDTSTIT